MNTWASFLLPRAVASTPRRVTQSVFESQTPSTVRMDITTGLFETPPHRLAQPARGAEPAWKREQHRRSAGRPR